MNSPRTGRRRLTLAAAALGAALSLLSACAGSGSEVLAENSDGLIPVKLYLAIPTFNTALINLVLAEDLDEKHGLEMEAVKSGAGSTNQVAALLAGDFDFVGVGTATAADAAAEGAGVTVVGGTGGLINNIVLNSDVVKRSGVSTDAPVEDRLKALKGLTIATSPPGSSSNTTLRWLVGKVGLDPDKDVKIAPVSDPSAIVAGIRSGQFDGSFFGVGVADANIADGSGELWVSLPRGDIPEFEKLVGVAIITTQKFAKQNPEVVERFHGALADAQAMVAADPAAAGESLREYAFADLDSEVFDIAWEQAKGGFPAGAVFGRENWDVYVDLFQPTSEKDYSSVAYEDFVAEPARDQ